MCKYNGMCLVGLIALKVLCLYMLFHYLLIDNFLIKMTHPCDIERFY